MESPTSGSNPTPSASNPTPSASNPTPSASNPTPSASNPTSSASHPTQGASDPTPSASDPTLSISIPTLQYFNIGSSTNRHPLDETMFNTLLQKASNKTIKVNLFNTWTYTIERDVEPTELNLDPNADFRIHNLEVYNILKYNGLTTLEGQRESGKTSGSSRDDSNIPLLATFEENKGAFNASFGRLDFINHWKKRRLEHFEKPLQGNVQKTYHTMLNVYEKGDNEYEATLRTGYAEGSCHGNDGWCGELTFGVGNFAAVQLYLTTFKSFYKLANVLQCDAESGGSNTAAFMLQQNSMVMADQQYQAQQQMLNNPQMFQRGQASIRGRPQQYTARPFNPAQAMSPTALAQYLAIQQQQATLQQNGGMVNMPQMTPEQRSILQQQFYNLQQQHQMQGGGRPATPRSM